MAGPTSNICWVRVPDSDRRAQVRHGGVGRGETAGGRLRGSERGAVFNRSNWDNWFVAAKRGSSNKSSSRSPIVAGEAPAAPQRSGHLSREQESKAGLDTTLFGAGQDPAARQFQFVGLPGGNSFDHSGRPRAHHLNLESGRCGVSCPKPV